MNNFQIYLQNKNFSLGTINTYCYLANKYLTYEETEDLEDSEVNYKTILKYITYLKRRNTDKSVNLNLIAIRHYFNFKNLPYNPVNIRISRKPTVISTNTYTVEQLHEIYDDFPSDTITNIRDKVLVGLFVFQGIQLHEVKFFKVSDIDLNKMTLTIQRTNKNNLRVLNLDIKQVLLLNEYINQTRNDLVANRRNTSLIITSKSNNSIRSILNGLNLKLRKIPNHPKLRLIRTSVIKNWLETNDLRTVQYYAGHKYISSTERYVVKDIEHLKKQVLHYHPL
jgi:site-specific recombinase XerD